VTTTFPISGNLVAIPADSGAAPAPMVGFRLITEPKDARIAFTPFYKAEIGCCEEHCRRFGYRGQNGLRSVLLPYMFDAQRLWLFPYQARMALRMRENSVQHRRIPSAPSLSLLDKRPDVLPQISGVTQKRPRRDFGGEFGRSESCFSEPRKHIRVSLKQVQDFFTLAHARVQEIKSEVACQKQRTIICRSF
jgi:hypothetical protein